MRRLINLYGLPAVFVAMLAWLLSTAPPTPFVVAFVVLVLFPILGIARLEGRREEREATREMIERASGLCDVAGKRVDQAIDRIRIAPK